MTGDPMIEHDQLVSDLRGALHEGESGLNYVPRLLRRLLETEAWRKRYDTKTRQTVTFGSFTKFVTTPPTEGLGASMDLVDRIVGEGDPDLVQKLHEAKKIGQGHRSDLDGPHHDSWRSREREETSLAAARLARDAPGEYAAVQSGDKTIHRAAVDAGIRKPRGSVRFDNPESAARTLRKHMSTDDLSTLARLLMESEE